MFFKTFYNTGECLLLQICQCCIVLLFQFRFQKSSTKTYKMSEEMCSVARLLNLSDCKSKKRRVLRCFTKTKDISELSEFERDLLLLRSGLNSESVST